jgi:hypothetical protein
VAWRTPLAGIAWELGVLEVLLERLHSAHGDAWQAAVVEWEKEIHVPTLHFVAACHCITINQPKLEY